MSTARIEHPARRAAQAVARARLLVVAAGAGMGVDSGLPDFRGPEGFWRAYPAYRHLRLSFEDLANPLWFERDPRLAWGFYGHRLALYRDTTPHAGFGALLGWARRAAGGGGAAVVFTSNVDGQFQAAGFPDDAVCECHGSIHHLQCLVRCGADVAPAEGVAVEVDPETGRAVGDLPRCPACGGPARPAILMFGDAGWDARRTRAQATRLRAALDAVPASETVVVECGAGLAVPTVRRFSEDLQREGATLVRINTRDPEVPADGIALECGALRGIEAIGAALAEMP